MNNLLYRFTYKRMYIKLLQHLTEQLAKGERQRLLESSRRAGSKKKWLTLLVQFGQEIEMSASLARMQNQQDEYMHRLRLAGQIYAFVRMNTAEAVLQERMERAEQEIRRRL